MTKLRLYPHRVIPVAAVTWRPWWREVDGVRTPLPSLLDGWDYAREERIGVGVIVDPAEVLDATGLESTAQIKLVALAECRELLRRFTAAQSLPSAPEGPIEVTLTIPAGEAAHRLHLSTHLVLADPGQTSGHRVPRVRGARTAAGQTFTLTLEGDASRFPTEAVAFSSLGLEDVPWTMMRTFTDLDDSFMGGVRLFINTEHPIGQRALDQTSGAQMKGFLQTDILRILVGEVARSDEVVRRGYVDGSVGDVLSMMCEQFLRRDLESTIQVYRDNIAKFERLLHLGVNQWDGVI